MAYQWIPTRDEDQQRVLQDVACSPEHHATVAFARRRGGFPACWALDGDSGSYLVGLDPDEMRPEFERCSKRDAFCLAGAVFDVRFHRTDDVVPVFGDRETGGVTRKAPGATRRLQLARFQRPAAPGFQPRRVDN